VGIPRRSTPARRATGAWPIGSTLQVGLGVPGLDQRRAETGEEAHLVVDGPGVAQQGVLLAGLGAPEHAPDGAVEQADAVVGEAHDRVEHGGDERGAAPER
jgi:hypothetical protein